MNLEQFGEVVKWESLQRYNTYRIGGRAKYVLKPFSIDTLIDLINYLKENNEKYYIIGNGSNIILPDEDYDGVLIITTSLNKYEINEDELYVEAGMLMPILNKELLKFGYTNFIWASGIPGSIGGSIIGNAGAYNHEIFDDLISIKVYFNGIVKEIKKSDISFSYRETDIKGIVLSAKFNLSKASSEEIRIIEEKIKNRYLTQPIDKFCAGSTFRNPSKELSAGKLVDDLKLKGFSIGGAKISEKHANFIVNENNATSKDILDLINYVRKEVKKKNNIDLQLEQKIVKWN